MEDFLSNMADVFDEKESVVPVKLKSYSYNAKICTPEWFFHKTKDVTKDCIHRKDTADNLISHKYRGDRFYLQGYYESALVEYNASILASPDGPAGILRDTIESKIRCLIKLGKFIDIETDLKKLQSLVISLHHQLSFLYLHLTISELSGEEQTMIIVLQCLLSILPLSANFWLKLANIFQKKLETPLQRQLTGACLIWAKLCFEDTLKNFKDDELNIHEKINDIEKNLDSIPGLDLSLLTLKIKEKFAFIGSFDDHAQTKQGDDFINSFLL